MTRSLTNTTKTHSMMIDLNKTKFLRGTLSPLAVTLLAGVSCSAMAGGFAGFEGVRFIMPQIKDQHLAQTTAMELSDGRMFGKLEQVGAPLGKDYGQATLTHISVTRSWWGSEPMVRMSYKPRVVDENGKLLFRIGSVEKQEEGLYDFADREKREAAARAMAKTSATLDADWIMFDEPIWGHRGIDKPAEMPISETLKKQVSERIGRPFAGLSTFNDDPEAWHAFVYERQVALAESLKAYAVANRSVGKKVAINLFPAAMESGAVSGFEIATAMKIFAEHIDLVQFDPYYTLFVEDPRYAGFMLRLLDDSTPRNLPMLGWIDSVDGLEEKLAIKLPPASSMKPQLAVHLANGSDHLAVWSYGYMERMGNLGAFAEMTRWIRDHQALYRGNPELHADTALYFSNLTFVMQDYFPKAWSHGTGPFGQYFTALNTYYMATANHVPLRVVSTPLGHEDALAGKLAGLKRLIVADAQVMSDREVEIIQDWVSKGGVLINIGRSGVLNEFKKPRPAGLPGIAGIHMTNVQPRKKLTFTEAWSQRNHAEIAIDGSNESVLVERYRSNLDYALASSDKRAHNYPKRWPLHLRDGALANTTTLADPKITDWAPGGGAGLAEDAGAVVLARYDNNEAAIVSKPLGAGRVIQVAPVDWLTRYRDPQARQAAHELFYGVTRTPYQVSAKDEADLASIEFVPTERRNEYHRSVVLHLVRHVHDDQGILASPTPVRDVSVKVPIEPGEEVSFVTGFSPDSKDAGVSHRTDGEHLNVTLGSVEVYTAVLVGIKRSAPPRNNSKKP